MKKAKNPKVKRCFGYTQEDTRCKNKSTTKFCWTHNPNRYPKIPETPEMTDFEVNRFLNGR